MVHSSGLNMVLSAQCSSVQKCVTDLEPGPDERKGIEEAADCEAGHHGQRVESPLVQHLPLRKSRDSEIRDAPNRCVQFNRFQAFLKGRTQRNMECTEEYTY